MYNPGGCPRWAPAPFTLGAFMTISRTALVLPGLLIVFALPMAHAQSNPCPTAAQFAHEVERQAVLISYDTSSSPRPLWRERAPQNLVQFVVDTLGNPIPESLRRPRIEDVDLYLAFKKSGLATWRFTPARLGGCAVPQLVQVAIAWPLSGKPATPNPR